ncbi:MAG: protoheme IX farnesyltransferase [Planctomycetes bacterium]|nr:protoheme IX farnesyltransferase [Planctomycetota bacterium]
MSGTRLAEPPPVVEAGLRATPRTLRSVAADYLTLTKPGISTLVLATTYVGYQMGARGAWSGATLLHALLGTALGAAGASALNMVMEKEADGRMRRTRNRPIPAGRLDSRMATAFGVLLCVVGVAWLALAVNPLAASLCALTQATYLFLYTPLKSRTTLNTIVGAVPGAIPPLIGWAAARGTLDGGAWCLFAILLLWQLPHFLAIAWRYRTDYARGGFAMLPVVDAEGSFTGRQVVLQAQALLLASLAPVAMGLAGRSYLVGALALGIGFLVFGVFFARLRSDREARRLFLASIVYLPALLALLVADKVIL